MSVPPTKKISSIDDFIMGEKLGDGAYSSVYRVKRKEDGEFYALKKVNIFNLSEKERENALNEVRILASCQNRNVISYKEAFIEDESNCLWIIMEYANNKDLYQMILEHTKKKEYIKENEIW